MTEGVVTPRRDRPDHQCRHRVWHHGALVRVTPTWAPQVTIATAAQPSAFNPRVTVTPSDPRLVGKKEDRSRVRRQSRAGPATRVRRTHADVGGSRPGPSRLGVQTLGRLPCCRRAGARNQLPNADTIDPDATARVVRRAVAPGSPECSTQWTSASAGTVSSLSRVSVGSSSIVGLRRRDASARASAAIASTPGNEEQDERSLARGRRRERGAGVRGRGGPRGRREC